MNKINVPLSEVEIAKLVKDESDPARKSELLSHLSGDTSSTILIGSITIPKSEIAKVNYRLVSTKAGSVISEEDKAAMLSSLEIAQIFELVAGILSRKLASEDSKAGEKQTG